MNFEKSTQFDAGSRTIQTRYTLPETEFTRHGETKVKALQVTSTHYPRNKVYSNRIARVTVGDRSVTQVFSFGEQPPLPNVQTRAARYAEKNLKALHEVHIADIENELDRMLQWAAQAPED